MCKSASAYSHSLAVSSTLSTSFHGESSDKSDPCIVIDKKKPLTHRSRRSSTSSLPQPRGGLRMAVRAKIYNDKMIAAHKACLDSLVDLIASQREDIVMLNENTRRAECGIPPLPKQDREKLRRDIMKLQTEAVNANFHELTVLQKKNRDRKMPEEAETLAQMINFERRVQADLVIEATAIFEELRKKIAKMGVEHSILLSRCCDNCRIDMETTSAA
ncbi:hypothetical protein PRIPAC_75431 [Pristionchus pacificus]|uniref:Uncharacterized protein n=1 Tax=Pristionchus pacificus TaxID=54126 RepID=A0A2A6BZZ2_PRIPA|nr:hypothetical protein PRIPAC_75431 [Pristionchus pacificus]|eukprot:PDM71495.1 hypothetical protein PRIPAC_37902 [Pristionchus pacificus]